MIYRMTTYEAIGDNIEVFNRFFNQCLKPVQLKRFYLVGLFGLLTNACVLFLLFVLAALRSTLIKKK